MGTHDAGGGEHPESCSLGQADAWDGDLGEDVRGGDGAVGVACHAGLELW